MFLTLLSIFIIFIALILYFHNRNQIFKKLNIPGPEPWLIFGNVFDVFASDKVQPLQLQKWTAKYGPIYGFMDGGRPMLVSSDPDFIQEILVKKFDYFHGRKEFALQIDPDSSDERVDMFIARGPKWKRLRVISNPTFTSAKIKQMLPKVHACVHELLDILEEKCQAGKSFDIHKLYQCMTMDVIGRVAFAMETSVQHDENNELMRLGSRLFSRGGNAFLFIPNILPEIKSLVFIVASTTARLRKVEWIFLHDRMKTLVEAKRKSKDTTGAIDFINLLLNAEADPQDTIMDSMADNEGSMRGLSITKKLTAGEIASSCFVILLAGYETTSTALSFITYLLAKHPEIQEKLLEEIDEHFPEYDQQSINYESVHKLQYLECVIQETIRLYPLASPVVSRRCMKSCTVKDIPIKEGMTVLADVWSLHYNEDYWGPDVQEFKPERFLPDHVPKSPSHPFAYLPFGAGPRTCIGMRFALLEIKVTLCSILTKYRFKWCPETEDPLQLRFTQVTLSPRNGVHLMIEKRK